MSSRDFARLVSHPHFVEWCGFETTTAKLQQAGWEIAAEQDWASMGIRLMLRHEGHQMQAITAAVDFYRHAMMLDPRAEYRMMPDPHDPDRGRLRFRVIRMARVLQFGFHGDEDVVEHFAETWKLVDAEPQIATHKVVSMNDLNIFATPLTRTEELIVDPADVGAILEKIKAAQRPEQERIRARQRLRESREGMMIDAQPQMNFHAQILSIAA